MKSCSVGDQRAAAHHHRPRLGVIHRHDGNIFARDVLPDIELGPVGKRENADVLALIDARIVDVPQFGALILRVPLAEFVAERVDAFFGAALLFVAPCAAKSRVIAAFRQAIQQGAGLQESAAFLGADADADWRRRRWPADWYARSVSRRWKRRTRRETRSFHGTYRSYRYAAAGNGILPGKKAFCASRTMHGRVLADRIQHDRILELGRNFANDLNALGFEQV